MRWRKLRTPVRWTATVLTAVVLIGWCASGWHAYCLAIGKDTALELAAGLIQLRRVPDAWTGIEALPHQPKFMWSFGFDSWSDGWYMTGPVWIVMLLTAIPASMMWTTHWRCQRTGSCRWCGYDRRGIAADAKCPECGTIGIK